MGSWNNLILTYRLERTLSEFEKEHQIPRRWEVNDPDYLQVKTALAREKQKQICLAMWSSVVRRQFLLGLKGKYVGTVLVTY